MNPEMLMTRTRPPMDGRASRKAEEDRRRATEAWAEEPFPSPRGFDSSAYERHEYIGRRARNAHRGIVLFSVLAFMALVTLGGLGALLLSDIAAGTFSGVTQADAESLAQAEADPKSTPKAQWRRGAVPYLYQRDGAWAEEPYGGGTIGTHGCGPTALSMAAVGLTGRVDCDPVALARLSTEEGCLDGGVTSWSFMTAGAAELGLRSAELPADADRVRSALMQDHPVICSVGPGDFTTDGHFIVLVDANDDGTVSLRDPNSPTRSERTWDIDEVLAQCRNLWEISR